MTINYLQWLNRQDIENNKELKVDNQTVLLLYKARCHTDYSMQWKEFYIVASDWENAIHTARSCAIKRGLELRLIEEVPGDVYLSE